MKANELMINDWVLLDKTYPPTHKKRVQISIQELVEITQGKDAQPIPLTAEILEKNGITPFKQTYEEAVEGITRYGVFGKNKEWGDTIFQYDDCNYFVMDGLCLGYVHQLQHVLRLHMASDWADNFQI